MNRVEAFLARILWRLLLPRVVALPPASVEFEDKNIYLVVRTAARQTTCFVMLGTLADLYRQMNISKISARVGVAVLNFAEIKTMLRKANDDILSGAKKQV